MKLFVLPSFRSVGLLLLLFATVSPPAWSQTIEQAINHAKSGRDKQAAEIFESLANQGSADAKAYLAIAHLSGGLGLEKNEDRAAELLIEAGAAGIY